MKNIIRYSILSILFLTTFLSALEFHVHDNNSKTLNAVMATGNVESNDVEKLDRYLSMQPIKKHTAVYLDSPGGSLAGGIRLGKYFKQHRIKTVIQGYKICASACALAFLGGTDYKGAKWMSSTTTSRLGFHAFSNADGSQYANSNDTQQVVALVLKYGQYVDIPTEILIKNFETPSHDIYWFSTQEELRLGIKVWDIQNERYVKNAYDSPKVYTSQPTYNTSSSSRYQQNSIDFIRSYFKNLKKLPYTQTWNMLSNSMKNKTNFKKYTRWWDRQVKSITILGITGINYNTVQIRLKFYLSNGKTVCSKDTLSVRKNGNSWLIDGQKSKTISCQ